MGHPFSKAMKFVVRPTLARLSGRLEARRQAERLAEVERIVVFVGAPRSGHSLVGALLDAHPEIRIAHELDLLRYVRVNASRDELFGLLLRRHRWFAARERTWTQYDYQVDGQDHLQRLRVLGDKAGGMTTAWLVRDATLLDRLQDTVGLPLHVVHHIRNPLDNLATVVARDRLSLDRALDVLTEQLDVLVPVLERWNAVHTHHDDLIADPAVPLTAIATQLQLTAPDAWLEAARRVVFATARRTRDDLTWSTAQTARLEGLLTATPWLHRYSAR